MKNELLLLEDVDGLGRAGDIVTAKPGYTRNFLLPKKKAVIAEKHLIRLRQRLKEEREKQAVSDRKDAEELAKALEGKTLVTTVKIDAEGHMYGSVANTDIVTLFKEQLNIDLDKKNVVLPKPIKRVGEHEIELKLKEGVPAKITLAIQPETQAE